jgi:hypothetical protein
MLGIHPEGLNHSEGLLVQVRVQNGIDHLYSAIQVTRHPVRTARPDADFVPNLENIKPTVFKETPDDAAHFSGRILRWLAGAVIIASPYLTIPFAWARSRFFLPRRIFSSRISRRGGYL